MKIGDLVRVKPLDSPLYANRVGRIIGKRAYFDRTIWVVEIDPGSIRSTYEFLPEQLNKESCDFKLEKEG